MTKLTATNALMMILLLLACTAGVLSFQQQQPPPPLGSLCRTIRQSRSSDEEEEALLSAPSPARGRRERKAEQQRRDYERRRCQWLERYGTFQALQSTFGAGPIWGDLTPEQTRRLYHTLLPRSLLGLHEMGLMKPEELAPLAYEARIAAKEYARSRCIWTARLLTAAFDQYRNLRDRGRFLKLGSSSSMTWDEIWQKYEGQIVQEECTEELEKEKIQLDEETLTMRIYLRILERSCATNQAFDRLFLSEDYDDDQDGDSDQLAEIAQQLEKDVRTILLSPKESAKAMEKAEKAEKKQQKMEKKQQKALEKDEKEQQKAKRKEEKRIRRLQEKEKEAFNTLNRTIAAKGTNVSMLSVPTASPRWQVLRILAGTRRKFRLLEKNSKRDVQK